jgi:hypothetical protein
MCASHVQLDSIWIKIQSFQVALWGLQAAWRARISRQQCQQGPGVHSRCAADLTFPCSASQFGLKILHSVRSIQECICIGGAHELVDGQCVDAYRVFLNPSLLGDSPVAKVPPWL